MTTVEVDALRAGRLRKMYASDRSADGSFITGVITTGIYCLPSCRARKPYAQNVRFFERIELAQEAGLRSCKRCRPDDFYADRNDDRDHLQLALATLRAEPGLIGGVGDLARLAGFSESKLHQVALQYTAKTPGTLIREARVAAAIDLLTEGRQSVTEVGFSVGYRCLSTFYVHFKAKTGRTPGQLATAVAR